MIWILFYWDYWVGKTKKISIGKLGNMFLVLLGFGDSIFRFWGSIFEFWGLKTRKKRRFETWRCVSLVFGGMFCLFSFRTWAGLLLEVVVSL